MGNKMLSLVSSLVDIYASKRRRIEEMRYIRLVVQNKSGKFLLNYYIFLINNLTISIQNSQNRIGEYAIVVHSYIIISHRDLNVTEVKCENY